MSNMIFDYINKPIIVDDEYEVQSFMPQATFTVTLGCLVENGFDLGMDDYPIFDDEYRNVLNAKIIRHYYFREIGQETPALFRYFLNMRLNEIMPYYNDLYRSAQFDVNPLLNVNMTTRNDGSASRDDKRNVTHDETGASESSATSNASSESRVLNSTTPQMALSGHEDYATAITDTESKTSNDSTANDSSSRTLNEDDVFKSSSTEQYVREVVGLTGITSSQAIMQYREQLLNIDMMIINELAPLFFGLYSCYANYL